MSNRKLESAENTRSTRLQQARESRESQISARVSASQTRRPAASVLRLQRLCGNREVQRALEAVRNSEAGPEATLDVRDAVERARGGGRALDAGIRRQMEPPLGLDLGSVRVHADARADALSRAVHARAFTTGRDIFFRGGQYDPASPDGRALIAHELAHVAQQAAGPVSGVPLAPGVLVSEPADAFERAAEGFASRSTSAIAGEVPVGRASPGAMPGASVYSQSLSIQRQVAAPDTAVQRGPTIGPEIEEMMRADVERIVARLRQQVLTASGEQEIVGIVEKWAELDTRYGDRTGYTGTAYLDRFLLLLKTRAYTRRTARSAWVQRYALVFDDLWYELEDERLQQFKALVSRSQRQGAQGPGSAQSENFWRTLGKQEAMGLFGILKGMGTGLAAMSDEGAWAVTRAMRLAGLDVADPASAAEWLAKQYDISGEALFGREWKEGDRLLLGMNAAEIGTAGGGVIWNLVMIGAAKNAPGWVKGSLAARGIVGGLKGVQDSANNIANLILSMQQKNRLTAANLLSSGEFWIEATKLAASIFAAVSGGSATNTQVAEATRAKMARVGILLDGAQAAAQVGRIMEVGMSDMSPEDKDKAAGKAVVDLIGTAVGMGLNVADYRAEYGSARQPQAQPATQQAVEPVQQPARPSAAAPSRARTRPVRSTPAAPRPVPASGPEGVLVPAAVPAEQAAPVRAPDAAPAEASPTLPASRPADAISPPPPDGTTTGTAAALAPPTTTQPAPSAPAPAPRRVGPAAGVPEHPGAFLERGTFRVTEGPSFVVRAGPPGSYADHIFTSLPEAQAYARQLASTGEAAIRETSTLPHIWPGGAPGNPVDAIRVFAVPADTPYIQGVVGPQPESGTVFGGPVTYAGGGPQVVIDRSVRLGAPLLEVPVAGGPAAAVREGSYATIAPSQELTVAGGRPPGEASPPRPADVTPARSGDASSPERLFERFAAEGVGRNTPPPLPREAVESPPPSGTYAQGIADPHDAYRLYNEALAVSVGREVAIFHHPDTGEYRVRIGTELGVGPGDTGWDAVLHYHPNRENALPFRLPAPADFGMSMMQRYARTGRAVEFVEFEVPGVGRGRAEYGIESGSENPYSVRIHRPGSPPWERRFPNTDAYADYWMRETIYLKPGSPVYRQMVANLQAEVNQGRSERGSAEAESAALRGGPEEAEGDRTMAGGPRNRNVYPDFEAVPANLQPDATAQAQRLAGQLGLPVPANRVLSAPWIGRIRNRAGELLSSATSQGWLRSESRFWSEFARRFPEDYALIGPGRTVTAELAQRYGWPPSVVGDRLVHHHMENGSFVVAIPESLHQRLSGNIHATSTVVGTP